MIELLLGLVIGAVAMRLRCARRLLEAAELVRRADAYVALTQERLHGMRARLDQIEAQLTEAEDDGPLIPHG